MTFTVAVIGRPNVGKSTLFNKMVGKQLALVDDRPGLTRDWREAEADFMGLSFRILDTAGLEESFDSSMEGRMRKQTESALLQADLALLVVDGRSGITPMDSHFAEWLRRQKIPALLVVNKCEGRALEGGHYEAYELGLGEPISVSAEHAIGFTELYDALVKYVPQEKPPVEEDEFGGGGHETEMYNEGDERGFGDVEEDPAEEEIPVKIAIVGRPNVGKSTLLNALVGEERVMTGPEPGVTRDAIAVKWEYEGRTFTLVDTAGLRRKARVIDKVEKMAVADTLRAIRLAQIVILVLDANIALEHQDLDIARQVIEEGRGLVIAVNKWDTVKNKDEVLTEIKFKIAHSIAQIEDLPTVTLSALHGTALDTLMQTALTVYKNWNKRVPTGKLNRWIHAIENHHPAPLVYGKHNRLRYITQIKARPPTFGVWVSRPEGVPESYQRYIINNIRDDFGVEGVVIRLSLRKSKNPYSD